MSPHTIKQPKLRDPLPNERVIRTAGLKFILPCNWSEGDILDQETADFLNAAHHSAVINGFTKIRQILLENPKTTYEDLDRELQGFFDHFRRQTRSANSSEAAPGRTPEERALISFARPIFNRATKTLEADLDRKTYEAALLHYVKENRAELQRQKEIQDNAIKSLQAGLQL